MSDSEEEFEEQLRLEKLEAEQSSESREVIEHGRVRTDDDGTEFEWDAQRKAWFPKISADFIANYQMNYGNHKVVEKSAPPDVQSAPPDAQSAPPDVLSDADAYWKYYYGEKPPDTSDPNYTAWYNYYYGNTESPSEEAPALTDPSYPKWYYKQCYGVEPDETNAEYIAWVEQLPAPDADKTTSEESSSKKDSKTKEGADQQTGEPDAKKKKPDPKWFEQEENHNTSVYVQGLPDDITEDELKDIMSKCGLIDFDYEKKKFKLKLYTDKETGEPKGDGLCTYIKRESVDLAMQLIDESMLRGCKLEVQLAEFKLKGDFNPGLRRKPKNNKAKRREKEKQAKLLDWKPDEIADERLPCGKTVVLKNLFDPLEFDKNPTAIQEVREDMRQECSKFGEMKKLTIFDRNADGVITVVYKEFESADRCVSSLNRRWFGGRRVKASNWDGKEKFKVKETAEEEAERLRKWNEYLETGGEVSDDKKDANNENGSESSNKNEAEKEVAS